MRFKQFPLLAQGRTQSFLGYTRGHSIPSVKEAKRNAVQSLPVRIFHLLSVVVGHGDAGNRQTYTLIIDLRILKVAIR